MKPSWFFFVFLIATGVWADTAARSNAMVSSSNVGIEDLSPDLVPLISDSTIEMVLAEIKSLELVGAFDGNLQVDVGPLGVNVIEVFSGQHLHTGMSLRIPVKRVSNPAIRVRNRINQWNNLALKQGALLILACRLDFADKQCHGLAATQAASSAGAEVMALRKCYELERHVQASRPDAAAFQSALAAANPLLFSYALDAVAKRRVLGREQGVAAIDSAMWLKEADGERRIDLAYGLVEGSLFDINHKADPVNIHVISILAKGLVSEHDSNQRRDWAGILSSAALRELAPGRGEDRALRMKLLGSVQTPRPAEVIKALEQMEKTSTGDDRDIAQELIAAWREAS